MRRTVDLGDVGCSTPYVGRNDGIVGENDTESVLPKKVYVIASEVE